MYDLHVCTYLYVFHTVSFALNFYIFKSHNDKFNGTTIVQFKSCFGFILV